MNKLMFKHRESFVLYVIVCLTLLVHYGIKNINLKEIVQVISKCHMTFSKDELLHVFDPKHKYHKYFHKFMKICNIIYIYNYTKYNHKNKIYK